LLGPDFARPLCRSTGDAGRDAAGRAGGGAAHHRATGAAQHLVVNRRPVRDPMLRTALRVAFADLVPRGRHPAAALFLDLPPEAVDVNVHPMKTELRFREAEEVRGLLISSIRRALAVGAGEVAAPAMPAAGGLAEAQAPLAMPGWRPPPPWRPQAVPHPPAPSLPLGFATAAPRPDLAEPGSPEGPLGRPIGQVMETYILAEAPDGALVLVDQHAAHERLTHEALRDAAGRGRRARPAAAAARQWSRCRRATWRGCWRARRSWRGSASRSKGSGRGRCWCGRCPPCSARRSRRRC
jgi:DNA mismatch repair protein MutL